MNKILTICLMVLLAQSPEQEREQRLKELEQGHVLAWARHKTGVDQDDEFESVAVIPGANSENETWVVVNRTIDGTDYRFIEQFQPVEFGDQNDAWFVDSGIGGADVNSYGIPATPEVLGDYPTLRTTIDQADLGLTHTTAISNVTQLQAMNDDKTGNYYLTGDIDASDTVNWNSGKGFKPIAAGDGSPLYFTGTFDGCGYTISDLFINWGQDAWTTNGLFGGVRDTAKIANVTLTDVSVTGNRSHTGALVGLFSVLATGGSEPIIQNCHASGTVTTTDTTFGYSYIGGLIGFAQGNNDPLSAKVYDCSSSCTVTAPDTLATTVVNVGGLIGGAKQAIVSNCFATGLVTGGTKSRYVGGLIGLTSDASGSVTGCDISYCYATGNVSGQSEVGGLIGAYGNAVDIGTCLKSYATGNVTAGTTTPAGVNFVYLGGLIGHSMGDVVDCYAWGTVTSTSTDSKAGGLIGTQVTTGGVGTKTEITNCYCIGAVSGVTTTGGFTADGGDAVTTSCYWDTEASGNATSDTGVGHTTTWLKTNPNYPATWDFDTIWYQEYTAAADGVDVNNVEVDHLLGVELCVYADGRPIGNYTVTADANGTNVIDLEDTYDTVIAGINYYSVYESFPLIEQKTGIRRLAMDFYETLGCNVGVSQSQSSDLEFSTDDFATRMDMFTGFKLPLFMHGWTAEPVIYLWQWEPVSLCVRGIYVDLEVTR